jgi:hypothetical protein
MKVGHNSAHFPETRGTVGLPVRAVEVGNKRLLSEAQYIHPSILPSFH